MGFRFRRSVRLIPGVRLNIGKKGTSLSVGGKGTTLNIGKKGTRTTLGVPGTGVSYSTYSPYKKNGGINPNSPIKGWIFIALLIFLFWVIGAASH